MNVVDTTQINTFGKASPEAVSPEETFLEIPAAMHQELLGAIRELQDEVAQLREGRAQDQQELDTLRRSVASLETLQEQDTTRICLDIAYDRQRITKLEEPSSTEHSGKTAAHLDDIAKALVVRKSPRDFMAFWEVEELLDLSHRRVSQLAEIAANDQRFMIGWHPRRKNTKVFRLNPLALGEITFQLHKAMKGE